MSPFVVAIMSGWLAWWAAQAVLDCIELARAVTGRTQAAGTPLLDPWKVLVFAERWELSFDLYMVVYVTYGLATGRYAGLSLIVALALLGASLFWRRKARRGFADAQEILRRYT